MVGTIEMRTSTNDDRPSSVFMTFEGLSLLMVYLAVYNSRPVSSCT